MNVITCVQPVNQEFNYKRHYKKQKTTRKLGISVSPIAVIFFLIVIFIAYLTILNMGLGLKSIKNISFWEEPSAKNAMRNYAMPIKINSSAKTELIGNASNLLSIVEFKNYKIAKGDTISAIAREFSLKNMGTILSINNIANAKKLPVGKTLRIPSSDGIFYTVAKGENLSTIANKFGVSLVALLDANDLKKQTLKIGQELFIPGATISNSALKKALGELFIYPINGRLTSHFGFRRDPFTGRKSFHSGIDLAAKTGTPVKLTMDGKVAFVGISPIYGKYIIVSHAGSYQSMYGHLSKIKVKRGQVVKQGSIIGAVGSTGRSTGPHLHLSIYKNGKLINPLSIF